MFTLFILNKYSAPNPLILKKNNLHEIRALNNKLSGIIIIIIVFFL